ncbi:MAG TPA: TonB-dependent receptor [Candidatus Eisenbacteria bacterium]|jgi:hypothetical protein
MSRHTLFAALLGLGWLVRAAAFAHAAESAPDTSATTHATRGAGTDLSGTVRDSLTGAPLSTAEVAVLSGTRLVSRTFTDAFGQYTFHNLPPGKYLVQARLLGYRPASEDADVDSGTRELDRSFRLSEVPITVAPVTVTASPIAVDTRTGNQVFQQDQFHGGPTQTTSQILQQSIAGAVRAPTGEVHIRGQHAEYTYYVDGIPVPPGISGSLNELFSPAIANQIEFVTGGWDAEFGNKNTAVVNVGTRIPSGALHVDASGFGGSFATNGQLLNLSSRRGPFGFVLSGSRQVSDMRQEPVVLDPVSNDVKNFHNHGEDVSGFAKLQYAHRESDLFNLDASLSQTKFRVPYDSSGGVFLDDNQKDVNLFVNASWRRRFMSGRYGGSELFAGAFHRYGTLDYTPSTADDPQFVFFPDTLTPFNLAESRNFQVEGVKVDGELRLREAVRLKAGSLASFTRGHEDFSTHDATGAPGPASNSDLDGSDVGVYAQAELAPTELVELRAGLRYDTHDAPAAPVQHQVSPRVRLNLYPDPGTTVWLYYGRLFMPTSIENLRQITSVAQAGVITLPTLPERDDFYELGLTHRFPVGVVTKLSGYYKKSAPGVDDNTVPGSSIVTEVNIEHVKVAGIEAVLEVQPRGPLTGYLNLAVSHAYGNGDITGGFFPTDQPPGSFDLDHDQRWSAVASATYSRRGFFASATATYGSGLTNGGDPDASYSTGLFATNKSVHVDPSTIVAASAGYSFTAGGMVLRPEIFADNLFDNRYFLKGAFFSGASVGRPRSVQVRLKASL